MEVKPDEIRGLMEYFSKNTYKARDSHPKVQQVMQRCLGLFGQDYNYSVITNSLGELSTNYPSNLVILEGEKGEERTEIEIGVNGNGIHALDPGLTPAEVEVREKSPPKSTPGNGIDLLLESESFIGSSLPMNNSNINELPISSNGTANNVNTNPLSGPVNKSVISDNGSSEASKLKELCSRARFARCRARFPVPVILYNKTHICRSATLSGGPEIYGRSSFDYFFSGGADSKQWNEPEPGADDEIVVPETQSDWQLFDRVRSQDIRLLKSFQVHTIVDLMVEKKKVKFGVNVTSSEKVDKENRYAEFNLISLPYPGCEFFKDYRDKGYNAEDLIFEWNQGHVDATIFVPFDVVSAPLGTDWTQYRNWDLVTLTQKYLKLLLAYVRNGDEGLLVHCISGWDRTPLFISLLRLSLWADGVIHKSLSAEQILYLTLAYDWLLFGHNLEDRLSKGEEILFFCFYFLKYIVDSEYGIEESPSTPVKAKTEHLTRVRNDSDIQLDGVLLDGDGCQTSPEGSSWSLSSVGSSQSNKSQDNPPSYFQIPQDSWEDCKGVQHMLSRQRHGSNHIAQNHNHNLSSNGISCTSVNNGISRRIPDPLGTMPSDKIDAGPSARVGRTVHVSTINSNGVCASPVSSGKSNCSISLSSPSSRPTPSPNLSLTTSSSSSLASNHDIENGCRHPTQLLGRTSPVAVPSPSRVHQHHRPESTSSASIGSWQLITGPGSLRDNISSSDPGSNSSHSHPTRLPINGAIDCIEASESSCTLIEELTPVDSLADPSPLAQSANPKETDMTESGWKLFDREDATDSNPLGVAGNDVCFPPSLLSSSCGIDGTPVNVTPTQDGCISTRRDKLQTVRAHFYTLYASAIGFKFRSVNDNGGSGGLGSLIGNLLGSSKAGTRTVNRTTNL